MSVRSCGWIECPHALRWWCILLLLQCYSTKSSRVLSLQSRRVNRNSLLLESLPYSYHSSISLRTVASEQSPATTATPTGAGMKREALQTFVEESLLMLAVLREMILRTPLALAQSLGASLSTFVDSSATLVPVALVIGIGKISTPRQWISKGVVDGFRWASFGALFTLTETFIQAVRNVKDKHNARISTAITSAVLRVKEGPFEMAQGFAMGYLFMVVIEQVTEAGKQQEAKSQLASQQQQQQQGSYRASKGSPKSSRAGGPTSRTDTAGSYKGGGFPKGTRRR